MIDDILSLLFSKVKFLSNNVELLKILVNVWPWNNNIEIIYTRFETYSAICWTRTFKNKISVKL